MMSDAVRVGLIGASEFVVSFFVPGLVGRDDFVVTAVCSRTGTSAAAVAEQLGGGARVYTDYQQMLAQEELDAVIVATPDGGHCPMVLAALDRGLHVLCDKPLTTSVRLAQEMYRAAVASGRVHMVNLPTRFAPGVLGMRQLVQSGELGPVYHADASWSGDYGTGSDPRSWKYTTAGGGAGAMADLGAHALDLLRWILGEVTQVCADSKLVIPERAWPDAPNVRTENWDVSHALLRFASGVPAVVRSSRVDTTGWNRELRIACAGGGVILREEEGNIQLLLQQPGQPRRLLEEQPYRGRFREMAIAEMNLFHSAILNGGPADEDAEVFPSFRDGERVQAIIQAIDESSQSGGWVNIAPGE